MAIGCLSSAGPPGSSFLAASAANISGVATPDDARIEDTPCAWGCMVENPVIHLLSSIHPGWQHLSRDSSIHPGMAASVQGWQHLSRDGSIHPGMAASCSLFTCGNWSRTCLPFMHYWKLRSDSSSMDVSYLNL